ncbi:hypothetical protein STAQ_30130 [Allostella sp. ATCC 35155]|nr:hypothetical protein STAQ_30130 [Stella sp. ATCC 35155]
MAATLNHTIVWCRDAAASAGFLAEILERPAPRPFHHFLVVDLDNGVSLDFMAKEGAVAMQHYAFLVDEAGFDAGLARVQARQLEWWADPARTRPGEINTYGGGRGFYFLSPDGHLLELMTKPYPVA